MERSDFQRYGCCTDPHTHLRRWKRRRIDVPGQPGYQVLALAPGEWTPAINAAWVQSGIDQGANFLLADVPTGANMFSEAWGQTMYATEMNQLNTAGYITTGNTMVPTLTLGQVAGTTLTLKP